MRLVYIITFAVVSVASFSCKKDKNFTQDHLDFSLDTLLFDTVFTTVGSTTKRFKIYNNNLGIINIDEIELMGGEASPFRINIDGVPGIYHENVEINGKDSLFAFVEVTLQVNNMINPFVISDSVRFLTNGLNQYVNLDVWGQDAYFHNNELVGDHLELWNNDKPHVLYGFVTVGFPGIDSNRTLTIPAGTDIYGHKDARLIAYKSAINMNGTLGNEVTFQGDRLESFYDDVTGQWWGIQYISATGGNVSYVNIKNAAIGIGVYEQPTGDISIFNSSIDNSNFFNLHVSDGGRLSQVENCNFGSAGTSSAFMELTTGFNFKHCNFVNYWSGGRSGPALAIRNWKTIDDITFLSDLSGARIDNCIAYGNQLSEIIVDTIVADGLIFDLQVNSSLLRLEEIYEYPNFTESVIWNMDPLFIDPIMNDFHLSPGSPCQDAGDPAYSNAADIEGVGRSTPDIGLYEL